MGGFQLVVPRTKAALEFNVTRLVIWQEYFFQPLRCSEMMTLAGMQVDKIIV